ncbi:MAG: TerB family tellurite resistance protein [Myxococcales bacterium]|jgi:tellurite resistance protein
MSTIAESAESISDLFLGMAHADGKFTDAERVYVRKQLEDLLCVPELSQSLREHMHGFDPRAFDLQATAKRLAANPPMRLRRLMELVAFVAVSDGELSAAEDAFIRDLGSALGLVPAQYRDLTLEHESRHARRTFTRMAVVPLPDPKS